MDNLDSVWQIIIIALVAGVLIGALAYRLLSPSVKRIDEVESDLTRTREEMASYKASVNQHFNKTSELVNDLTQNYVKVYQHLADGAQSLGDIGTLTNLLENRQGKVSIAVSDTANAQDTIPEDSPIDAAAIQAVDEDSDPTPDEEIIQSEPKDFEVDNLKTQPSEPVGKVAEESNVSDPVVDVESVEAASESAEADTPAEQESESAETGSPAEKEGEIAETGKKTEDKGVNP